MQAIALRTTAATVKAERDKFRAIVADDIKAAIASYRMGAS